MTNTATHTPSPKQREESRGTPSCQHFFLWAAGRKTSRGRSRRRHRRDPSSSPSSSSSPTTSSSDSESSFARKVKRALERSRTTENKAKEPDRILVPKFPQPENYRNWRIRVRDAIIAASAKPDLAFLPMG